jgi:hypothetical protein
MPKRLRQQRVGCKVHDAQVLYHFGCRPPLGMHYNGFFSRISTYLINLEVIDILKMTEKVAGDYWGGRNDEKANSFNHAVCDLEFKFCAA